jgi:hypothetical protein
MAENTIKTIINLKSMTTSPLTWDDYSKMVAYAIRKDITDFILPNDDIDFNYYAESRFYNMISSAKINVGIGGKTVDYIRNNIKIHYAINPLYPIKIQDLLSQLQQDSITSAYLEWSDIGTVSEKIQIVLEELVDWKSKKKIAQIGVAVRLSELTNVLFAVKNIVELDYIILEEENFASALNGYTSQLSEKTSVFYRSQLYNDIFLMVNLLYRKNPILRTRLSKDVHIKELLGTFLANYNFNDIQNVLRKQQVSAFILDADNHEVLTQMLTNSISNGNVEISSDLVGYLEQLRDEDQEGWWRK